VTISGENGMLQCFEGTADRQCLTGVRALRADSRSRLARLLDGVPGPATSLLPPTAGDPARSENANSQAYPGSEPHIVPGEGKPPALPWEWISGVPESLSQGRNPWAPSNSSLLLALVSVVASLLWFNRKVPPNGHGTDMRTSAGSVPRKLGRKTPADGKAVSIVPLELTDGATHTASLESQAVESRPSVKATPPETSVLAPIGLPTITPVPPTTPATSPDTSIPLSATDSSVKVPPVKPESRERAEDVGEVKKKHRKRRRRRKGDTKDAAAEEGEEPENEDGEGGEDGNAVSPGTPSLVIPSTPVPPASSSLVVSDTVLGMCSITYFNRLVLIKTRLRVAWHCCLCWFLARP
jgi:serine/threonine-protein kinase/endoribonuclease IRE1